MSANSSDSEDSDLYAKFAQKSDDHNQLEFLDKFQQKTTTGDPATLSFGVLKRLNLGSNLQNL